MLWWNSDLRGLAAQIIEISGVSMFLAEETSKVLPYFFERILFSVYISSCKI